jgi:hypothetical protein
MRHGALFSGFLRGRILHCFSKCGLMQVLIEKYTQCERRYSFQRSNEGNDLHLQLTLHHKQTQLMKDNNKCISIAGIVQMTR